MTTQRRQQTPEQNPEQKTEVTEFSVDSVFHTLRVSMDVLSAKGSPLAASNPYNAMWQSATSCEFTLSFGDKKYAVKNFDYHKIAEKIGAEDSSPRKIIHNLDDKPSNPQRRYYKALFLGTALEQAARSRPNRDIYVGYAIPNAGAVVTGLGLEFKNGVNAQTFWPFLEGITALILETPEYKSLRSKTDEAVPQEGDSGEIDLEGVVEVK